MEAANYKNVFGSPDVPALAQISRLLHFQAGAPIPKQTFFFFLQRNLPMFLWLVSLNKCSQRLSRATWRMRMLTINHPFGSLAWLGPNPLNSALSEH